MDVFFMEAKISNSRGVILSGDLTITSQPCAEQCPEILSKVSILLSIFCCPYSEFF